MNDWIGLETLEPRLLLSADSGLVSCLQLASDASTLSLLYEMPKLDVVEAPSEDATAAFDRAVLGDAPSYGGVGQPILPFVPARVVVPHGYEVESIEVLPGQRTTMAGAFALELGAEQVPVGEDAADATPPTLSPDWQFRLIDTVGVQQRRGVDILIARLNPVEYVPETGQLSYFDTLTLNVTLSPTDPATFASGVVYRPDAIRPLAGQVDNPGALATYEEGSGGGMAPLSSSLCDPADTFEYVIITDEALVNATGDHTLSSFLAHKTGLGLTATMVTVEDIYANYDGIEPENGGGDGPDQIREFVLDAYNSWETDYVLLGGDTNIVPVRELFALTSGKYGELFYPSDLYYQCLDGPFNFDQDAKWGESSDGVGGADIDFFAEVAIGRASANDAAEMATWVQKTVAYETDVEGEYRWHAEMIGRDLGWTVTSKEYMEEIRLGSDAHGYVTEGFASEDYDFVCDYPDDTLYHADDRYASWRVIADVNSNAYAVFNDLGHSSSGTGLGLTSNQVSQLTNDHLFFAYSQGCHSGKLQRACFAETITTGTAHGAVAVVMNSGLGWGSTGSTAGAGQGVNREFWDALFGEDIAQLGAMNADSHEDGAPYTYTPYSRAAVFATNLFGDPHLAIVPDVSGVVLTELTGPAVAFHDEPFELALHAWNGTEPYAWELLGDLPAGLVLGETTGVISGTPTLLDEYAEFTVQVTDAALDTAAQDYAIFVTTPLESTTGPQLPDGLVSVPYAVQLEAQGGIGPYTWTIVYGRLQDGLVLDEATGQISGIPEQDGHRAVVVRLTDSGLAEQCLYETFELEVSTPPTEIHGQLFDDTDGDGERDPGEVGLDGWTIELVDLETGDVAATAVTESVDLDESGTIDPETESGLYAFADLWEGVYEARPAPPIGWVSTTPWVDGRMFALAPVIGEGTCVVEIDPVHGLELGRFVVPGPGGSSISYGLAAGPESVFYLDGTDPEHGMIWELDPDTGLEVDAHDIGELGFFATGLAYLDGLLYVQSDLDEITPWDPVAGAPGDSLTIGANLIGGLAGAADLGVLFGMTFDGTILTIDPATGDILDTVDPGLGILTGGLAYCADTGELWAAPDDNIIYRIDPATGTTVGQIDLDEILYYAGISGLAGDGVVHVRHGFTRLSVNWWDIVTGVDFAGFEVASAVGRVWNDRDGDGVLDDDEEGLNGRTLELVDLTAGQVVQTTVTADVDLDGDGEIDPETETGVYAFTAYPGTYRVQQIVPEGWVHSHPRFGGYSGTVQFGHHLQGLDFGTFLGGTISGQLFHDLDSDAERDPDEFGINGLAVQLYDRTTGGLVATAVTTTVDLDENGVIDPATEVGWYEFVDLPVLPYQVQAVEEGGWGATTIWDTDSVYAVRDVVSPGEGRSVIQEIDPRDGAVLNEFSNPEPEAMDLTQGLAVGPESLFYVILKDDETDATLYELDLTTGEVLDVDVVEAGPSGGYFSGLAFLGDKLYVMRGGQEILVWDPDTDTYDVLTVDEGFIAGGFAANPDAGTLCAFHFGQWGDNTIYVLDPATGDLLDELDPSEWFTAVGGLAYANGELLMSPGWAPPDQDYVITRMDPATGDLVGTFTIPSGNFVHAFGGDVGLAAPVPGATRLLLQPGEVVDGLDLGHAWLGQPGDQNYDGAVDSLDVDHIWYQYGGPGEFPLQNDLDHDGDADAGDTDIWVYDIVDTEYADFNIDGVINATDLAILGTYYGATDGTWGTGDANGDHLVDATDLAILSDNYGWQRDGDGGGDGGGGASPMSSTRGSSAWAAAEDEDDVAASSAQETALASPFVPSSEPAFSRLRGLRLGRPAFGRFGFAPFRAARPASPPALDPCADIMAEVVIRGPFEA